MHQNRPEDAHDAVMPLAWTPTRGNDIPPHAVPARDGPNGQLYVARGLLEGQVHIGTTSPASNEGARLYDKHGRSHTVQEYEVLTCGSTMRFHLDSPQPPLTPAAESVRTSTTPRWSAHRESISTTRTASLSPPKKAPAKLAPFPWLSPPRGQPANVSHETTKRGSQNDPPPYSSPIGGWVDVPKHSGPVALSARENVQFDHLTQAKCFTLIDDTSSMQYSWAQTRAALSGLVDTLSSEVRWDGLNVRFIHHAQSRPCVKTREEFESIFNSVAMWRGDKAMAAKVTQVFEESLSLIQETSTPRPVLLVIITDGIPIDAHELYDVIIWICRELNKKCVPSHMFRIHMLQMGEDRKAVKPLHDFRDRITQRDRDRRILNVVSYHRGRGLLSAHNIFKLLLASTHVPIDEDPDIGERQPAKVIQTQYDEVENLRTVGKRWK